MKPITNSQYSGIIYKVNDKRTNVTFWLFEEMISNKNELGFFVLNTEKLKKIDLTVLVFQRIYPGNLVI